jgi:site-specific recombinase XerD
MAAHKVKVNLIFRGAGSINKTNIDQTGMWNAFYSVSVTGMGNEYCMSPFMLRHGDLEKGEVIGTADYAIAARDRLKEIRIAVVDHFTAHANGGTIMTPVQVCSFLRSFSTKNSGMMLTAVATDYIQTQIDLKAWKPAPNNTAGSSERLFRSAVKKFQEYLKEKHRSEDYPIQGIDLNMLTQFEIFMRKKGMAESSTANYIIVFMAFFKFMVTQGYLKVNPFLQYDTNRLSAMAEGNASDLDRKISKADVIKLKTTVIHDDPTLERYRKIACVQMCTGMAWIDLHLVGDNIHSCMTINLSGMPAIIYNRHKNSNLCIVPIDDELEKFIKDLNYNVNPGSYKVYCAKLVSLFKRLAITVGGKERSNKFSHALRHVFGNEMLEKGYTMESVSRMMGHKGVKMTEKTYAKINGDKIASDYSKIKSAQIREQKMQISS